MHDAQRLRVNSRLGPSKMSVYLGKLELAMLITSYQYNTMQILQDNISSVHVNLSYLTMTMVLKVLSRRPPAASRIFWSASWLNIFIISRKSAGGQPKVGLSQPHMSFRTGSQVWKRICQTCLWICQTCLWICQTCLWICQTCLWICHTCF